MRRLAALAVLPLLALSISACSRSEAQANPVSLGSDTVKLGSQTLHMGQHASEVSTLVKDDQGRYFYPSLDDWQVIAFAESGTDVIRSVTLAINADQPAQSLVGTTLPVKPSQLKDVPSSQATISDHPAVVARVGSSLLYFGAGCGDTSQYNFIVLTAPGFEKLSESEISSCT